MTSSALLDIYEVAEARRAELLELARKSRQQPWWYEYREVPSASLVGYEFDAASIRQYVAMVFPGLFQTREYARAVLRFDPPDAPAEEFEQRLKFRMHRQELLTQEGAPDLWIILDEATLHRPIVGPAVMREQLQRLIEVSALPKITLQVLPFSAGPHAGLDGDFTMFSFSDPADPTWCSSRTRGATSISRTPTGPSGTG